MAAHVLGNFTAEAFETFFAGPQPEVLDEPEKPSKPAKSSKPKAAAAAPIESQGEPPPLTMEQV